MVLQHRKTGRIKHWFKMKKFDRHSERIARRREKEFERLIKAGRKTK